MTYNLVVGFLVPSERDSSSRSIGSSIGERGHVWYISQLLVCIWDVKKWSLAPFFIDFISKAVFNSLELLLLCVVNLLLLSIGHVYFHILSSEWGIGCLFLFLWWPLISSTLYSSSLLIMSGSGAGSLCWLAKLCVREHLGWCLVSSEGLIY